jgi:predicted metal-binding membrane protein
LDHVDGVGADARTDLAGLGSFVSPHVDRDDDSDDAAILGSSVVAIPTGRHDARQQALALADRADGPGYFLVWAGFGIMVFPLGIALAGIERQQPTLARTVPMATAAVVLIAGALQFTAWKARQLGCCREVPGRGRTLPADAATAWRHGLRLGVQCSYACAGLTATLLVVGVMDLRGMALVTAGITAERLAPNGKHVARAIGAIVVVAGLFLTATAAAGL